MTLDQVREAWRNALADAEIPGSRRMGLRGVKVVDYEGEMLYLEVPEALVEDVVEFFHNPDESLSLRRALEDELADDLRIHVTKVDGGKRTLPDHIPAGFTLPGGTYVAHAAYKGCECVHCTKAYEAYQNGNLKIK